MPCLLRSSFESSSGSRGSSSTGALQIGSGIAREGSHQNLLPRTPQKPSKVQGTSYYRSYTVARNFSIWLLTAVNIQCKNEIALTRQIAKVFALFEGHYLDARSMDGWRRINSLKMPSKVSIQMDSNGFILWRFANIILGLSGKCIQTFMRFQKLTISKVREFAQTATMDPISSAFWGPRERNRSMASTALTSRVTRSVPYCKGTP